ncbi:MAG: KH domain-containing protein [Candidatus Obscuribacterales bacterium]|nr:KH domain-containing protein [Candidatus Obscuribacterales bacterium]
MDEERRPAKRDGGQPYKKGRGRFVGRGGNRGPRIVSDSTAAEDLAEYVITVLARDPNAVQITRESQGMGRTHLSILCDPAVTGRLIGKDGRTITALRQFVRAVAGRHGKRVDIEVALPNE